ncbi:probable insulin-like peptide 7 [Diprion similis]|uniref:probable insulin-like peptide 7 n=1 Tax=Diprion similis TaxID=362088 RepID=UPI001EF8ECDE|nr:probable insulin-like peptide 7 [Diprion similis]
MRASALAIGCLALEALGAIGATDHLVDLERVFKERSRADWENAWHRETHARCRETLLRHLYWACEKDIYGVSRRSGSLQRPPPPPWVSGWRAKEMVRYRRDLKRRSQTAVASITQECCAGPGCTWEEYAEYCPANKRVDKRTYPPSGEKVL